VDKFLKQPKGTSIAGMSIFEFCRRFSENKDLIWSSQNIE